MPDPDLEIRGGGLLDEGGGVGGSLPPKTFLALQASVVWSKNKGGGWVPRASPLDSPLLYHSLL